MWKTRVRVLLVTSALSAGLAAGLGAPAASAATCGTTTSTTIPQSCSGSGAKPKPPRVCSTSAPGTASATAHAGRANSDDVTSDGRRTRSRPSLVHKQRITPLTRPG